MLLLASSPISLAMGFLRSIGARWYWASWFLTSFVPGDRLLPVFPLSGRCDAVLHTHHI